jgi:hypothetical protein
MLISYHVILSEVFLDEGEKNVVEGSFECSKILRSAGLCSASSGYAQNDILIYNVFGLSDRILYLRRMFRRDRDRGR